MKTHRVDLGEKELTLEVCEFGIELPGKPLFVMHGFLEQGAAWQWVAEHLNRPVFAPDQRGHGRSEHVGDGGFYHFWDYVSDLDLLLERLSPDTPVDLLGHSMGGTVASLYAGTRPERISRLVLVEGLGPPDTSSTVLHRAGQFLAHRRQPRRNPVLSSTEAAASRMMRHNPRLGEERARVLAERTTSTSVRGAEWTWDARHRARSPTPFVEAQFNQFLAAITAPTLVVWGAESAFPGIERASYLTDARIVKVPDAGHLVHLDQPEPLARAVEAFLLGS